jgi:hypothetical protein
MVYQHNDWLAGYYPSSNSYLKQNFGDWTVSASSGKKLTRWAILVCFKMDLSSSEDEARQYPHAHLANSNVLWQVISAAPLTECTRADTCSQRVCKVVKLVEDWRLSIAVTVCPKVKLMNGWPGWKKRGMGCVYNMHSGWPWIYRLLRLRSISPSGVPIESALMELYLKWA